MTNKEPLVELVYTSHSISDLNDEDVSEILRGAHEKNKELGITGVLVYYNGEFMQLIEGTTTAINLLFQSISHDARHYNIKLVSYLEISERHFDNWEMGFVNDELIANSFLKDIVLSDIRQNDCRKILQAFSEIIKD